MEKMILLLVILIAIGITLFILGYFLGSPTIINDCNNPLNQVILP